MGIETTAAFRQQMNNDADAVQLFCDQFSKWKHGGEYSSYFFGKDAAYITPKVGTEAYKLRHVHLVPILDTLQLQQWNTIAKRKGRKTSGRVLVYVHSEPDQYLLIYILPEPDAHRIAQMKTLQDRTTMLNFAAVAEAFVQTGKVIV